MNCPLNIGKKIHNWKHHSELVQINYKKMKIFARNKSRLYDLTETGTNYNINEDYY